MQLVKLDSHPLGVDPTHINPRHMVKTIGENLKMLHTNHPSQHCEHLIFINTKTGETMRFEVDAKYQPPRPPIPVCISLILLLTAICVSILHLLGV